MKLPVALAALFLAATTAAPAFAATPAPRDMARYHQAYRNGANVDAYHAYAASPRAELPPAGNLVCAVSIQAPTAHSRAGMCAVAVDVA